jgi:putative ABC transport system permease protein
VRLLDQLRGLLRSLFRSGRIDADLAEELEFHVARQTQANIAMGMTPNGARRAARIAVGSIEGVKEQSRAERPGAFLRQIGRDLRHGARGLRRAPAFAVSAILIIALGIGAVTAIFSVVYGVMLRPLPYPEPERLVTFWSRAPTLGLDRALVGAADHQEWRRRTRAYTDIALVRAVGNFNIVGDGEPERLQGARVSANLFPILGVTPLIGRTFTEDEDEIGHENVVLLSWPLWQRRFGGDAGVIGTTIRLNGIPHVVVGVMGPAFAYPANTFQIWTPLTIDPAELTRQANAYNFIAVARLRPGVTAASAQRELDAISLDLQREFPQTNKQITFGVASMLDDAVRGVRPALRVLLGAVSCLLLIACLNLANLLAARATTRSGELAVRVALGASRGRLARQAIAEVMPLLFAGGVLGIAAGAIAVRAFVAAAPAGLPRIESVALHGPVLVVALGLLVLTGVIAAALPARQAWRSDFTAIAKEHSRSATGGPRRSLARSTLVVAQFAFAVPLLVGAAVLVRSFRNLTQVSPGFRAEGVLSLHLAISRTTFPLDAQVAAYSGRLVDAVSAVPGVTAAGMVNRLPLGGGSQINSVDVEGAAKRPVPSVDARSVSRDYFRTMTIPIVAGRGFTARDDERAPRVVIVDDQLARAAWPGQSPIGKRVRVTGMDWGDVIGVAGHIRHEGLDVDPRPQVYYHVPQRAQDRMVIVVRGAAGVDPASLIVRVTQAIHAVEPEQALYDVRAMTQVVARSLAPRRLTALLLAAFAAISLVLASVGVYGVVAFGVAQRMREFGIRLALGATQRDVTRLVVGQGARLALGGTAIGLAAAVGLAGAMRSLVFGVAPRDAASLAGAAGVLIIVAIVASWLPARRAAAVDVTVTMRGE